MASASAVSAAVVYHSAPPITSSTSFSIDATDNDFTFNFNPGTMDSFVTKFPMPGFPSTFTLTPISGQALITSSALSFGDTIDGSDTYTSGSITPASGASSYYGFSLTSGQTLYGWIKMTYVQGGMALPPGSGSIDEWAYDDSGASIQVGQTTAVPEPATAGALAALLAGSAAAWKRRRRQELAA